MQYEQLKGLKIVFASDFHVKPYGQKRLDMIVEKINAETPDIVVSAGDFVCGHTRHSTMPIEQIAKTLGKVKAKFGFYTSLGNTTDYHLLLPKYEYATEFRTSLTDYEKQVFLRILVKLFLNNFRN